MKVINGAVLSCLDDVFYRLPFPNLSDLEKLIKEAKGEANMIEFRKGLRAELDTPRAVQDFEQGWEKYWQEMQSVEEREAAGIHVEESFDERNRTPETSDSEGREGGGDADSDGARLRHRYDGVSSCCCPPPSLSSLPRFPQLNFLSVPAGLNEQR